MNEEEIKLAQENFEHSHHIFGRIASLELRALSWKATKNRKDQTILYFHGGGLVYGTVDDLPEVYRDMLLAEGYDLISLEYPLAPETRLDQIRNTIKEGLCWFQEEHTRTLSLASGDYILFGRSAGAYLALLACREAEVKPQALLLLYGYHSLQEASFRIPSRHYLQFPAVGEAVAQRLVQPIPVAEGTKEKRYALYVHYRQTGTWIKNILPPDARPADYSLTETDLAQCPPAFLAAATGDPDVPYRVSEKVARLIPGAELETVDSEEHDFDRVDTVDKGPAVYRNMLDWLERTAKG